MKGILHKDDKLGWIVLFDDEYIPVYQHTFDMTKHSPKSIITLKEGAEVNFTIEDFWETGLEKTIQVANLVYTDDRVSGKASGLDETYYNEFLDRLTIIGEMIERFLIDHPVCDKHDNIYYLVSEAMRNIVDAHLKTQDIINVEED